MRGDKRNSLKSDSKSTTRSQKRGVVGYSKKTALLEEAITQMNAGKYGRTSDALKELLALDPQNMEARRLFATLHLRLGSLIPARQAFDSLVTEAVERQDYWLAESLLQEYLAAGPRCVPFLEKLGLLYQEKGSGLEAATEYGKAIDILIEDSDAESLQLAAELYKRVRELAPASPVAFRLASLFDAQTGNVLVSRSRQSTGMPESHVPSSEQNSGGVALPEPVRGVMPWETEMSPAVLDFSAESSPPSSGLNPSILPADKGVLAHEEKAFDGELRLVDSRIETQTESTGKPAHTSTTEEQVVQPAPEGVSSTHEPVAHVANGSVDNAASFTPSLDLATVLNENVGQQVAPLIPERVFQSEPTVVGSTHEQVSQAADVCADPTPSFTSSPDFMTEGPIGSRVSSTPLEDLLAAGPDSLMAIKREADTGLGGGPVALPSEGDSTNKRSGVDHESVLGNQGPAPTVREQDQPPEASASSHHVAEVKTNVSAVENASVPFIPENAEHTSTNSSAEPWKKPGFSWESLSNKGLSFKETLSEISSGREASLATGEESSALENPSPSAQQCESDSIKILERTEPTPLEAERPSVPSIRPMPWDQIEESSITISSTQIDEIAAEPVEPVADHSIRHTESSEVHHDKQHQSRSLDWQEGLLHTESFSITEPPSTPSSPDSNLLSASAVQARYADRAQPDSQPAPELLVSDSPPLVAPQEAEASEGITPSPSSSLDQADCPSPVLPTETLETLPESDEALAVSESKVVRVASDSEQSASQRTEASEGITPSPVSFLNQTEFSQPVVVPHTFPDGGDSSAKLASKVAPIVPDYERCTPQEPEAVSSIAHKLEADCLQPVSPETATEARIDPPTPAEHKNFWELLVKSLPTSTVQDKSVDTQSQNELSSEEVLPDREMGALSESVVPYPTRERAAESVPSFEKPKLAPVGSASMVEVSQEEPIRSIPTVGTRTESPPSRSETEVRNEDVAPRSRSNLRLRISRMRRAAANFVGSCFSTTRAIVATCVGLVVVIAVCAALGVGTLALIWVVMEESPSVAFQSFTTIPQRTLSEAKKNGYLLLLGFEAPDRQDAIQIGAARIMEAGDAKMDLACLGEISGMQGGQGGRANASAQVANEWFRGSNPVGQFKLHYDTITGWVSQYKGQLARYAQWHTLPFEDWGYGQTVSPPCSSILFIHHLYLSAGFTQAMEVGVERWVADMQAWRSVLSQAKTLSVKMLALQAINDDIAVASGLLVQPDIEPRYVSRLAKQLRSFDQEELSLRWPMQSELVVAKQTFDAQLKAESSEEHTVYAMIASKLPLPKQRRLNDYAEYYDASYKVAGEGQYSAWPKWKSYIQFPADSFVDYFTNPIENVVGLDPLPPWDVYNGLVVDTEASLRLASLQAWIRSGPQDADLLTRIAKAGQALYDPYTGLPMLVNIAKGVLYSVGHDGKDQEADPQTDVVVTIPLGRTSMQDKPFSASSKYR